MTDIWVCSNCHSLNRLRATKCYKCGAPQSEATGQGATLRAEQAIAVRSMVAYRSSWFRAVLAAVCILGAAATGVLLLPTAFELSDWAREQVALAGRGIVADDTELRELVAASANLALARIAFTIAAVVTFGAWLSRVIMNVPALGGGTPSTTPTKAFVYSLIPIVNLWKVPGMVHDALYRLDPKAGGFFMVLIAWFGVVGSAIIDIVADWYVNLRVAAAVADATSIGGFVAEIQTLLNGSLIVAVVTTAMIAIGAVVLVLVMLRIEIRSWARDREVRIAAGV